MYMREPAAGAPIATPMRSGYVSAALILSAILVLALGLSRRARSTWRSRQPRRRSSLPAVERERVRVPGGYVRASQRRPAGRAGPGISLGIERSNGRRFARPREAAASPVGAELFEVGAHPSRFASAFRTKSLRFGFVTSTSTSTTSSRAVMRSELVRSEAPTRPRRVAATGTRRRRPGPRSGRARRRQRWRRPRPGGRAPRRRPRSRSGLPSTAR